MRLYVEVMCDLRLDGSDPKAPLHFSCITNAGDNPQGRTVSEARKAARKAGWRIGPKHKAICPGCLAKQGDGA
ncbi:MAG: hypothetical protein J0I45_16545 [Bosea sp.]|nr:hypothetical protein [Bosea sp. (in: a-proteobacteria)]